jgi:3D (Asp-Asp-Asp) domain-containing protein
MKNLARGSVFFALAALIGFLFYFQPTVVAEGTFSIANDSPRNIQLEQIQQNTQINQQLNNQTTESTLVNLTYNNFNLSETKAFRATAYCLKGRTATGGSVRRGIVAADRRVLPLGTKIQISAGAYSGTYTVADTGGAVKGNTLDIWVPSCAEANRFGRRTVMVSVVGK